MKTSSYNLIMSAMFNGRKGERPPVGNPTSVVCHGRMDAAGVSFPDAHLDANAMADLALKKLNSLRPLRLCGEQLIKETRWKNCRKKLKIP